MGQLTFIDFFSGIGGFRLGLERAGHKCIGFCEKDKFAVRSYRAMYETEGEWYGEDITGLRPEEIPRADIWTAGSPCQNLSLAGKRAGLHGDRSRLFFDFAGLIKGKEEKDKPGWVILENVKGLLSSGGGRDFLEYLSALAEAGYDAGWAVYNSKDYGVPQNRERVYTVGHLRSRGGWAVLSAAREGSAAYGGGVAEAPWLCFMENTNPGMSGCVHDACRTAPAANGGGSEKVFIGRGAAGAIPIRNGTKRGYDLARPGDGVSLAYPNSATRRGRVGKGCSQTLDTGCQMGTVTHDGRLRRLTPRECFRLQGFPDDLFEKAAAVNSNAQLYRQAGNAVTVNVAHAVAALLH